MLYLIGLGLNEKGISREGAEIAKKCQKVYLENYTADFPYIQNKLETITGKKINPANRDFVESVKLLDEAKKSDIVLLVYGSPLAATTHISIIQEAKKRGIRVKVIHSASVFDAVSESGLQFYKFGKTTSMPNFNADSYIDVVKQNLSIKAHSLILVDIGLGLREALEKLERDSKGKNVKLNKILICSRLGTGEGKIYHETIGNLKKQKIRAPFCIIIPGELHFMEREFLENFKNNKTH